MSTTPDLLDGRPRSWTWRWSPLKGDFSRLCREVREFRVQLELLTARSPNKDGPWLKATQDQLANITALIGRKHPDVEGGWVCFHAAKRHAILGLDPKELPSQASMIRAEAAKITSWRSNEILKQLSVADDKLTAENITNAMVLRDEYYSNQYHKIWMVGDQLWILIRVCGLGLGLLVPLVWHFSRSPNVLPAWGAQMVAGVLSFGLLGAAYSAASSLMNVGPDRNIPERVTNQFVTLARAIFGAGAGIAGYAMYQCKLFEVHFGLGGGPGDALAIAFWFGFAGEKLFVNVFGGAKG